MATPESGEVKSFNNSRQARDFVREAYGRYVLGEDRFPKVRLVSPMSEVPPQIRPVAGLLAQAWQTIDLDRQYFWDMMDYTGDRIANAGKDTAGLVVAKVGRNAVQLGSVAVKQDKLSAMYGVFTARETEELVNGLALSTSGGDKVQFVEGNLVVPPIPDMVIVRDRPLGAASFFDGLARAA